MISKKLYDEISSQWGQYSAIYQKYNRLETRYPKFLKEIAVFKDKHVLEIGANAGMAAWEIAKVASRYTGVERATGYWHQSQITKKYIENPNVEFLNCTVKSYIKRLLDGRIEHKPNACYMSYVFYHFENKEVELFCQHVLPMLDVAIIQSRYAKRNIKGRTKHNDYGLWHPDNVRKLLEKSGMNIDKLVWGPDKKFHLFVASRSADKSVAESESKRGPRGQANQHALAKPL
jgi:hypothetical protein